MKIEKVEIRHIKLKLISPFVTSKGTETHQEHLIISVTSEGLTGWGECVAGQHPFYTYETVFTSRYITSEYLIPSILHKDLSKISDAHILWKDVQGHPMAKAGVEAALTDVFAKSQNISLAKYFGGEKKKIDVGVSIGLQSSSGVLLKKIDAYLNGGYKRIKVKIERGNDFKLLEAVRKVYPDILLQVDANSAYTLKDISLLKQFDDFNLLLIEQPFAADDLVDHAQLQAEMKTPICLDESISSLASTKAAFELKSCQTINIKPGRVGGFTEAIGIHDYCREKNIPVWHGGMLESGIGRAGNIALASLANFTLPADISASSRYYEFDIVEPEFVLNSDGTIDVPSKAGIGVEISLEKLDKVTQQKIVY